MTRKQRSDSTTRQLQASQATDLTTATAPRDVLGAELLNAYGQRAYDQFYRARGEWSVADLTLICQAALCLQTIAELEASILPGTIMWASKRGAPRVHPAVAAISDQRRQLQTLLRDAGLRQRDGTDKRQPQAAPALHGNTGPSPATAKALATDTEGAPDWDSLRLQ